MIDIIANQVRRLCLSMRFQILMAAGALLFLFAAWSGAARHELRREAFAELAELEQERFERVKKNRAWNDFVVQVARPPAPTDLIHDGKSDYMPDIFGFNPGSPQRIHYSSSLRYNFAIARFNRTDWTFVVSYLFTFGALALSFDAVTAEREGGTLRLLGSCPVARHKIILGKHLAVMTVTMAALVTGAVASFWLFSHLAGERFEQRDFALMGFWMIGAALTLSVHAAVTLLLSTVCRRSSHSLYAAVAVWITFVVGIPSGAQLAARQARPTQTAAQIGQQIALQTTEEVLSRSRNRIPTPEQRAARSREVAELYNGQLRNNLSQVFLAASLAKLSPDAVLNDSLNRTFRTGIHGLQAFAAETALQAATFSEQLKRSPDGLEHPIRPMAESWRRSEPPPPPWTDWAILAALNALILSAACIAFERSDLN